jgi:hypothetical protein
MLRHEAINNELDRLPGNKATFEYCKNIILFVISNDEQLSSHLTYRHIGEIVKADPGSDEVHAAVTILCSRFRALTFRMELFDTEGQVHDLTDDELTHFLRTGDLAHPYTGQPIDDPDGLLVPYFKASKSDLLSKVQND